MFSIFNKIVKKIYSLRNNNRYYNQDSEDNIIIYYVPALDLSNNNINNSIFLFVNPIYAVHAADDAADDAAVGFTHDVEQNSIYSIVYNKENINKYNIDDMCPITFDKFKYNQHISMLECGHCFDSNAIITWFSDYGSSCPVCRK